MYILSLCLLVILVSILLCVCVSVDIIVKESVSQFITSDLLKQTNITVVLSDIDGTLANDDHKVNQKTIDSIRNIKESGLPFFIATGRNRRSALKIVGSQLVDLLAGSIESLPGVFNQGLEVFGQNGKLIHSVHVEQDIVTSAVEFGFQHNVGIIAAVDDGKLCDELSEYVTGVVKYAVSIPTVFEPGLRRMHEFGIKATKMYLIQEDSYLRSIRPQIDTLFEGRASITSSVEGLIEILPLGANKGEGVKILLNHFNMSLDSAIAFGDNENDIEMLSSVGFGIAVANAVPTLKSIADAITDSNNNNGVAHVLDMIVQNRLEYQNISN